MTLPISIIKSVLNFKYTHVEKVELQEETYETAEGESITKKKILIYASPFKRHQKICPLCGKKYPGYDHHKKDGEYVTWRAPNLNGIEVEIRYNPSRIKCPTHGVITENIPWADRGSRFTEDFNNEIAWMVTKLNKTAISVYYNISFKTVGHCLKIAHSRLEPDITDRLIGLQCFCVDEIALAKGHKYMTVVYDMIRGRTAWMHIGYGDDVMKLFAESLTEEQRNNIKIIAGDGAQWIDRAQKKYFPNAVRCVDFFHVNQWATKALDDVRIIIQKMASKDYEKLKREYTDAAKAAAKAVSDLEKSIKDAEEELAQMPKRGRPSKRKLELLAFLEESKAVQEELSKKDGEPIPEKPKKRGRPRKTSFSEEQQSNLDKLKAAYDGLKRSKFALGHSPENCTDCQLDKIELIANDYPDLYKAYQLKESLRLILHMKDPEMAKIELEKWDIKARETNIKPLVDLADKINRHKENILNAIQYQANSAKSEATNSTIKYLIHMGRGFRNFENLKALVFLKCSDIIVPLNNRIQESNAAKEAKKIKNNEARIRREEAKKSAHNERMKKRAEKEIV